MAGTDMKALAARGKEFAGRLSPLQKIALGAVTLTLVAGAFVLTQSSSAPAMSALYTDLSGSDASSVVDELTSRGVQYQLTDAGHTVLVPKDQVYDLRVDLAGQGLPASNEGYALLDDQGITTSEFRQRIDYQRALEGELAKTLLAMDNIASASVHLALPEESVFVDQPADPTASVMVDPASTGGIDDDQVQAIIHLVSSSVKGMQPEDVTVIDANGAVLSAPGVTGSASGGTAKTKAETAYEQQVAAKVTAAIARVAGADKVSVSVAAELDLDQEQATSEDYGPVSTADGADAGSEKVSENCAAEVYGEGVGTNGSTGVLGPDGAVVAPTVPSTVSAGGYQSANCDTAYAVDRTVTESVTAPGDVKRLSIAVLVDETAITEEQQAQIEAIVKAAAGVNDDRGDTVKVERMKFDTSATEEATKAAEAETAAAAQERTMELIRTLAVAFVILIAVILAYRSTRKARKITATPIDIGEIRSGSGGHGPDGEPLTPELASLPGAAAIGDGGGQRLNSLALAMESKNDGPIAEIQEIAETRPEEVANVLRAWLAESKAGRR